MKHLVYDRVQIFKKFENDKRKCPNNFVCDRRLDSFELNSLRSKEESIFGHRKEVLEQNLKQSLQKMTLKQGNYRISPTETISAEDGVLTVRHVISLCSISCLYEKSRHGTKSVPVRPDFYSMHNVRH